MYPLGKPWFPRLALAGSTLPTMRWLAFLELLFLDPEPDCTFLDTGLRAAVFAILRHPSYISKLLMFKRVLTYQAPRKKHTCPRF